MRPFKFDINKLFKDFGLDEMFNDFEDISRSFTEDIEAEMSRIDEAIRSGELNGDWDFKKIDKPGVKGYVVYGRFASDRPFDPMNPLTPFEPVDPWKRPPMPSRLGISDEVAKDVREPVVDVFEDEKARRVYVELPGEEKSNIQLNITDGKIEVKAKNFYKMIKVPTTDTEIEKASSKYKNGVLEITIPKKEKTPEREKQRINIE